MAIGRWSIALDQRPIVAGGLGNEPAFVMCARGMLARVEAVCWVAGVVLSLGYVVARADSQLGRNLDADRVDATSSPDFSAWSDSRRRAYEKGLQEAAGPLLGKLVIRSVDLEVPVYGDTSERHLNRGAGVIEGTSIPDVPGNVGIAGHRDGFFRKLKDVQEGEMVEVLTWTHLYRYRISAIHIVSSDDARLLAGTGEPVITLVTCYPFYFVGHAPQRFVVRGELVSIQERKT